MLGMQKRRGSCALIYVKFLDYIIETILLMHTTFDFFSTKNNITTGLKKKNQTNPKNPKPI